MTRSKPEQAIGAKNRPFTGAEYLASLRDGREIYVYGERVEDVTAHPAFRNAARLVYRYGIPFERKVLVTTDSFQSATIESDGFARRCDQELRYQPAKVLSRLSPFDLEITNRIESLQSTPMDPLDP